MIGRPRAFQQYEITCFEIIRQERIHLVKRIEHHDPIGVVTGSYSAGCTRMSAGENDLVNDVQSLPNDGL